VRLTVIIHFLRVSQPYRSLEAELHDAFWDAEDNASEVRLMADFLKNHPGPALEMGAGSGRLMFPLILKKLDVEGVELSPDMLELANQRGKSLGVPQKIHQGDMTTWEDGRKFASILAPAFTLQLAADPERTLRHWHSLLENHGGLYLTIFMPYAELLGDLPEHEWYEDHQVTLPDGRKGRLETRHRLDHGGQLLHREHRYSLSGNPPRAHESAQTIRWFEHAEILELLEKCGFRCQRFFTDFNPKRRVTDPDKIDFDGILTYHLTRLDHRV
jgi:SAM-dependent methyltransferase